MNNYGADLFHSVEGMDDLHDYGIPQQKKFPLDSRDHVLSAIRFFNYAEPQYRKQLALAIIKKVNKYGIKLNPSKENLFYNYTNSNADYIAHYGVLGQRWGVRRYQNADGTLTPLGKQMQANRERYGIGNKSYNTGEARINRRLNKLERFGKNNRDLSSYASNNSIRRNKAANRDLEKRVSMDILTDPKKLEQFGKYTRRNRVLYAAGGAGAAAAGAFIAAAASTPVIAVPVVTAAGVITLANEVMSRS